MGRGANDIKKTILKSLWGGALRFRERRFDWIDLLLIALITLFSLAFF